VAGTYAHGFFADDAQRRAWITRLGADASAFGYDDAIDAALDALAAHLEQHLAVEQLLSLAR
jgi:adenosylcobyric acid synthase